MDHEIMAEVRSIQAHCNRDAVIEFMRDIADYLNEHIISEVFEYLEDGSIGFVAFDHGHLVVNYLTTTKLVKVNIYLRRPFSIPELEDRLNFYFIGDVYFKEMN